MHSLCFVPDCGLDLTLIDISHRVRHASAGARTHAEALVALEGRIEVEACSGAPVSVYILWLGNAATSLFVVLRLVGNAVLRQHILQVGRERTLKGWNALLVIHPHILGERRF